MTITTLQQMIDNMQAQPIRVAKVGGSSTGYPRSLWYSGGFPASGTIDTTTVNGYTLSSATTGAIPFTNPSSGETRIASMIVGPEKMGLFFVIDRLWQCNVDNASAVIDCSSASTFNIVSPTWPARDNNGSSNGEGVILALEAMTGTSGSTHATIGYTNSDNVSGRTATTVLNISSSAVRGAWHVVGLQSGDKGVRSVQSISFATPTTGACQINIVAHRVLGAFIADIQTGSIFLDALTHLMPPIPNDACLSFWYYPYASAQTGQAFNAAITLAQG